DDAEDYADFTERLCDKVCEEPSPPLLEYFAVFFAFHVEWYTLIDRLHSSGKISDLASPIWLIVRGRRGEGVSWDDIKRAMMKALSVASNDWITCHLYLTWRFKAEILYPECDVDIKPIDAIKASVNENSDLEFFKAYLLHFEALGYLRENKTKEGLAKLEQALAVTRRFDDQILSTDYLIDIASYIKHSDPQQGLDLFTSAKGLGEKLGYKDRIGMINQQLGHMKGIRGEMDAAIENQIEYKRIRETLGLPTEYMSTVIAFLYNQIGDGAKAYEYAKIILDFQDSVLRHLPYTRAQLCWALINLGRYEEAKVELAAAQTIAYKSGTSEQFLWVRMVEGILDKEEGRFDTAIECLTEVLNYTTDDPRPVFQNICLLNLTEIEIELFIDELMDGKIDTSGPWMQRLFEHAENNDFPGIAARALLLKAEFHRRQGRLDEVRRLLIEVQETAKTPSMRYLNDIAVSMFPKIFVS
ncbi:MAG: tetratricopeptide repeat protein, partial [Promethearchaeota archaeon]